MNKFFVVIFSVLTIGFISSCTKENGTKQVAVNTQADVSGDKADMGSGD